MRDNTDLCEALRSSLGPLCHTYFHTREFRSEYRSNVCTASSIAILCHVLSAHDAPTADARMTNTRF